MSIKVTGLHLTRLKISTLIVTGGTVGIFTLGIDSITYTPDK